MRSHAKSLVLGVTAIGLFGVDCVPEAPFGIGWAPEAQAIIGRPLTPMSYAGVARRTAYRTTAVVATSAAVATTAAVVTTEVAVASASAASASAAAAAAAAKPSAPAAPAVGTIVTTLPPGCAQTTLNNVEYQRCGSTYYRASFMGPNLVFVVSQP